MNETKKESTPDEDLSIRDSLSALTATTNKIDNILTECVPIMNSVDRASIHESLVLAKGIDLLRQEFQKSPAIKATITAMTNSRLGFLTDRSPAAIIKYKNASGGKKQLKPYTYEELTEAIIEGLMKGYRISNNEMNVIAYNFYPAKNGKFRHIIEYPQIANFKFYNGLPSYEIRNQVGYQNKMEKIEYAQIECFATYRINNETITVGRTAENPGDKIIFRIRVNKGMMEDSVIGKAHSKLFTRILQRLTGRLLPESEDITLPALEAPDDTENMTNSILDRDLSKSSDNSTKDSLIQQLKKLLSSKGIPDLEFSTYTGIEKIEDIPINDLKLYVDEFDLFVKQFNQQIDQDLAEGN